MKNIIYLFIVCPVLALCQTPTQNQNYIKTTTYKLPTNNPIANPADNAGDVQVSYFDGLGRPIQQIARHQSASGKNIVTHIDYDNYGRQVKEYLPYKSNATNIDFVPNAESETLNFYQYPTPSSTGNPHFDPTISPFSEKLLEQSPLGRVLEQAAPGDDWAMPNGHTIRTEYKTNVFGEVRQFKADAQWNSTEELYDINFIDNGMWNPNQLYKSIVKNENWQNGDGDLNTTIEFKDKEGNLILKRIYGESVINLTPTLTYHDTYYVYDDFGNLTYVIPPLADLNNIDFDGLCYQYKYDSRNRMTEKKLPGKQWEFIVYDTLDRVVSTGPVLSPFGGGAEGWMFSKYDVFGRVCYTGWYPETFTSLTRKTLQTFYNTNPISNATRTAGSIDSFTLNYSSTNLPSPASFKLLTVNYYDDYNHPYLPAIPTTVLGENVATNVKGLSTGGMTRVLVSASGTQSEISNTLYDKKGRTIRSYKSNFLGGYTRIDFDLDFLGKATYTFTEHRISNYLQTVEDFFDYSNQEKPLTHYQSINGGTKQLIAHNVYDELGQLITKKVGGTDIITFTGLQKIDYSYNVRGWLKSINDTSNLNVVAGENDLFAFQLTYNDVVNDLNGQIQSLFNGNISESYWITATDNVRRQYSYAFDHLNRMKKSIYQKLITTPVLHSYDENVEYDKNGNIVHLMRNGGSDTDDSTLPPNMNNIDDLDYEYNDPVSPNRLTKVIDNSNIPVGFIDGTNSGHDYSYDLNGNMKWDYNKDIQLIDYNHLNLPITITFGSGDTISYLYDALGQKVQKKVTDSNGSVVTDYVDGYQYTNGIISFFPHPEGYVKVTHCPSCPTSSQFLYNYVFNYTDHLGNIRVSYGIDPQTNVLTIMEQNHYYPFGLKHTNYNTNRLIFKKEEEEPLKLKATPPAVSVPYQYKYNGKEWQDELSLNLYDYGARNYDPALGRWMNIDPKAETSRRFSPYTYALNNPVYFIDPDGMEATNDYKLLKNGDVKLVKETTDMTDRILKTDSEGNVKTNSKGESKVAIQGIEKGILKDGQNFKNKDEVISIGGKGQPSVAGVKSFTMKLSEHIGKEIKGFSYSSDGSGKVTDMLLGRYADNTYTSSSANVRELIIKYGVNFSGNNMVQQFHTHPDGELGATQSDPEMSKDVQRRQNDMLTMPNASFIVLYRLHGQSEPAEFDYTHN